MSSDDDHFIAEQLHLLGDSNYQWHLKNFISIIRYRLDVDMCAARGCLDSTKPFDKVDFYGEILIRSVMIGIAGIQNGRDSPFIC